MPYTFVVAARVTAELDLETKSSIVSEVDLQLFGGNEINEQWKDLEGLPNHEGSKAITEGLILGLVNNIQHADYNKFRDAKEHVQYIKTQLDRAIAAEGELAIGEF